MIFKVTRTSDRSENKPCDKAFISEFQDWDVRTCSEEEFNERFSKRYGKWRDKGTNHCVDERGYIKRLNPPVKAWAIEIANLDELIDFVNENEGRVVVSVGDEYSEIEIYDSYRE